MHISRGDLADPRIIRMLRHHFDKCHEVTPPGSAHVFDVTRLAAPEIDFWAAWDGETLLGTGAMKPLGETHGEVKSMHTAAEARRRGVASALLRHIIETSRGRGLTRLSLETGSFGYFEPAVALYKAHGFEECPPFGAYRPDPNSVFLTRKLRH
ncbi:GNAT family N-acetyltransferase [Aestuariivirga sp.]|uniref:GNAT family N-acetyltransferase n=1 Tax=Aestuariivirga sp. TaxID=2650926 RepID=UPI0025C085E7|nr:GNAT family N-acetyltransferase [Aestuariivirga sp.]MCA3555273.1 GNAT family N-acetyltransferase [Aestuariivirga sp.]